MYKMYLMGKFPKLKQIMAKCNLNSCKRNILIPLSLTALHTRKKFVKEVKYDIYHNLCNVAL